MKACSDGGKGVFNPVFCSYFYRRAALRNGLGDLSLDAVLYSHVFGTENGAEAFHSMHSSRISNRCHRVLDHPRQKITARRSHIIRIREPSLRSAFVLGLLHFGVETALQRMVSTAHYLIIVIQLTCTRRRCVFSLDLSPYNRTGIHDKPRSWSSIPSASFIS